MGAPEVIALTPEVQEKRLISLCTTFDKVDCSIGGVTVVGVVFLHRELIDELRFFSLLCAHDTTRIIGEPFGTGVGKDTAPLRKSANVVGPLGILVKYPPGRISL